jgi:hypothetical protein
MATIGTKRTATSLIFNLGGRKAELIVSNVSKENAEEAKWYGLQVKIQRAAALPAGSSDAAKFDALEKMCNHLNSGSTSWVLKMTPAEREAAEHKQRRLDLVEALRRLKGLDETAADALIAKIGEVNKWLDERHTVGYIAAMEDVRPVMAKIKEERRGERAPPGPAVNLDDVLAALGE